MRATFCSGTSGGVFGSVRWRKGAFIVSLVLLTFSSGCPTVASSAHRDAIYKRDVGKGIHDTTPVRGEMKPLALHQDGDAFPCSSCHDGFTGDQQKAALENTHQNISFDHGSNSSCFNCHNQKNSDAYVDYSGNEIPGDQPGKLCAKCHGPQTREWEHGVHGRSNGHWDAKFGDRVRLECVQCHDPHKPRFALMAPRPAPRITRFDLQPEGASPHAQ